MDRKPHHRVLPDPFKEWAAKQVEKTQTESTHRCSTCMTPYGRSAIACPNDPRGRRP